MKKLTSLILALTVILGLSIVMPLEISAAPFAETITFPQAIAESFEGGSVPVGVAANKATLSVVSSGREVDAKALSVTPSATGNSVYFAFGGRKNGEYNFSFLYKNIDISNFSLNLYFKTSDGNYKSHQVSSASGVKPAHPIVLSSEAASNGWTKGKATFTDYSEDLKIGYLELVSSVSTAYMLDEVTVVPVADTSAHLSPNVVADYTFDTSAEVNQWIQGKWSHSPWGYTWTRELTTDAAAGNGAMRVKTNGGGWVSCYHQNETEVLVDRTYNISFWAKANNEATVGQLVRLYVDREENAYANGSVLDIYKAVQDENQKTLTSEWHHYKMTYKSKNTADTEKLAKIFIRVGSASTDVVDYSVDELVIQSDNIVPVSSFDMTDQYKDLTLNNTTTYPNAMSIEAGEAKVGTNSLHIVSTDKVFANVSQQVDLRVGRTYNISFWAKAGDEDTVGKSITLIVDRSNSNNRGDAPQYQKLKDDQNLYLTENWVQYNMTYRCTNVSGDTISPKIYLRVNDSEKIAQNYYVDELIIRESPNSYKNEIDLDLVGNAYDGATVSVDVKAYQNSVGAYYRLYVYGDSGYELVNGGFAANGTTAQYVLPSGTTAYRLEYNAVDSFGIVGPTKELSSFQSATSTVERSRVNFDTSIWVNDMPTLDATVEFQSAEQARNIFAVVALYDKDNMLVSSDVDDTPVAAIKSAEIKLSAKNDSTATKAKIFLWEKGTYAPIRTVKEIEKTKSDYFLYVDPVNGSDDRSVAGTYNDPVKTISRGVTKMRTLVNQAVASGKQTDITLVLMPGTYNTPLTLTSTNTADNVHLNFVSYKPKQAIISGGTEVTTEFTPHDSSKNIYVANVGSVDSRQLYVNGVRAVRARSEGGLKGGVNLGSDGVGLTTTDTSFMSYQNISDLELVFCESWTNHRFKVDSVTQDGSTGLVTLHMNEELWNRSFEITTAHDESDPRLPLYYENAYELLDKPGEFYLNNGYLYYIPRTHEDLDTAEVVLPTSDYLMKVTGTNNAPMKNIKFDGIAFQYSTWADPENGGVYTSQNNVSVWRINSSGVFEKTNMPAAITLSNVHNVDFSNCEISKIGQTGIKMVDVVQNCDFVGNELADISANGLILGDIDVAFANETDETKQIKNVNITDNYIHDIAIEYSSGSAISAAFPIDTNISHNEIYNVLYSGMHIGYGWDYEGYTTTITKNLSLNNNYIHKVLTADGKMSDGGGIYTLGGTSGSLDNLNEICGNYIYDVGNAYGALYPDEGSSYWHLNNNVVDLTSTSLWVTNHGIEMKPRWTHVHKGNIHDIVYGTNYSTTTEYYNVGTDIQYQAPQLYETAKWPTAAKNIINNAGIRPEYLDNFDFGIQEVVVLSERISVGESTTLTYYPTTTKSQTYDTSNAHIYFASTNPNVVTVSNDGRISGISKGTAVIKITVVDDDYARTFECEVIVY